VTLRLILVSLALIGVILAPSHSASAEAAESSGCKKVMITYPDGSQKPAFAPPRPQGTLTRLSNRRFRFTWRFETLPAKCRPSVIALGLKFAPPLTIIPFKRPVKAKSGTYTTFSIPATLASKVIYGQLWAEGRTGLLSDNRRVPLR
jgi:hypothetical protein